MVTASFSQTNQTVASGNIAGTGFTSTTTAGTAITAALGTNGLTMAVPAFLTAAAGGGGIAAGVSNTGNTAGNLGTASTGTIFWQASGGITASQSTAAGSLSTIWMSVPINAGTGTSVTGNASITLNTNGIAFNGSNLAGVGTSITGNASMTVNSVGIAFNGSNLMGVGTSITGRASITANSVGIAFNGSNLAGVGTAVTGNITVNVNSSSVAINAANLAGTVTGVTGQAALTVNTSGVSLTVPATSSLVGVSPISVSVNASTISVQPIAMSQYAYPADLQMIALGVPVNGSASVQMVQIPWALTATRADVFAYQSISSSGTTNTYGQAWSIYMGLYSNDTANNRLVSLSTGSVATSYTVASNTAGITQINGSAIRPISCPINVNATPGLYYFAVQWSTNTTSVGASTTALNRTISMMGGLGMSQSASYAMAPEYTVATAVTNNSIFPQGTFTTAAGVMPGSISYSQISMTGAAAQLADLAVMFRNA